jgi:spore germination protein KA
MPRKLFRPKTIREQKVKQRQEQILSQLERGKDENKIPLTDDLAYNLDLFKTYLHNCSDVVFREIELFSVQPVPGVIIYIDGMVDRTIIDEYILHSLMGLQLKEELLSSRIGLLRDIKFRFLNIGEVDEQYYLGELLQGIMIGNTVILLDGCSFGLNCSTKGWEDRAVSENTNETVVRGPREAFVENIRNNTALIRRRLKTHRLKVEEFTIGVQSQTKINMLYLEGIAQDQLVEEVRVRLGRVKTDRILALGEVESFIQDAPFSPFPTMANTDRPDVVTANILEGRVALVIDGTPMVGTVPAVFWEFLQSSEDFYERFQFASFLRLLRASALFVSLVLPSLYVAITTFHQEMLPTPLILSVAAGREGVPFPALLEALIMELTFEVLREAGLRLPKTVGQTISIVGALVVGEAAVRASLVSPLMVIVVSLTAISSFTIPNYSAAISIRLLRFPLIILSGLLGFYGLTWGLMLLLFHLLSLRSFGVPYLSPVAPQNFTSWKDIFIRAPLTMMVKRPEIFVKDNQQRMAEGQTPKPPQPGGEEG